MALAAAVAVAGLGVGAVGSAPTPTRGAASYFVAREHVSPVRRLVPAAQPARGALLALLRGPSAAERRAGLSTAIPAGTPLRGISVARGLATVDLGRRFAAGGGSVSMLLRVAQVVHTLTQFPTVRRVAFRLDGAPVRAIGGEGVLVDPPVGRAAFEGQAPPILVEQPLASDVVGHAFRVSGTANVFEARLFVDVSANGRLQAHRAVMATSGTGVRGTFDIGVRVPATVRSAVVTVYTRSAKDGSRADVVRVAIRVR